MNTPGVFQTVFEHCMYGGTRDKSTRIASNMPSISELDLRCPGASASHRHQPWGWSKDKGFLTGEEAEYPDELYVAIAHLAAKRHAVPLPLPRSKTRG